VQQWAASNTSWLMFIFCLQQLYKHLSVSVWSNGSRACKVYHIERGAVLYCTERGSTVCFTLDRILSGRHRWLETKGPKISASHQGMKPVYRLNGSAYLQFIRRQWNSQSTSWALHICCDKTKFSKHGSYV